METIKIKYKNGVKPIKQFENGDWIDLRCSKDICIKANTYCRIPLGVCMELPKGYEALVVPRSSTFKKYHILLANSIGVIDESYCGDADEWNFLAYATKDVIIPKDTRICQFRIIEHQPEIQFEVVDKLNNKNRGGIGSTGTM